MVLDTNVVPDVLGLYAFNEEAALVQVVPSASPNIVRVLVPDDHAEPRGFHDLLIEYLTARFDRGKVRPASAVELRQHWPPSLLSGMTKRQADMESLHWDCKGHFGSGCPGNCPHCVQHINTNLSVT